MLELMTIRPRNPWTIFDELESLQADMNRLLSEEDAGRYGRRARAAYPPLNVWSSQDGLVVEEGTPEALFDSQNVRTRKFLRSDA